MANEDLANHDLCVHLLTFILCFPFGSLCCPTGGFWEYFFGQSGFRPGVVCNVVERRNDAFVLLKKCSFVWSQ